MEVLIIGAGIGGLTLGLMLHRAGIACRIFEAAPELKAVGVGINILPHASRELCALGLERGACEGRRNHSRVLLLQPLRPVHLQRAGRPFRRL